MRDDKSFPYILVTGDHEAPAIFKHRGARSRKGDPISAPSPRPVRSGRTINALQRAFLLRTCTDSVYESRTRPCLLYQIKRCAGPCTGEIDRRRLCRLVGEAKDFLSGRSQAVKAQLAKPCRKRRRRSRFRTGRRLSRPPVGAEPRPEPPGHQPADRRRSRCLRHPSDAGMACIQVFFFRTGQNWGNRAYFPKADPSLAPGEILGAFIGQFYDDKPTPRMILISDDFEDRTLLAEALSVRMDRKVTISVPQRGEKRELVEQVLWQCARGAWPQLAETASQARLLQGLAETFNLTRVPRRIEVYDNSHIMGTNAVGGMIVAGPEGFVKNQYRKFNIKSTDITPGDDFGMMREVMQRRFSRLLKDHGDEGPVKPAAKTKTPMPPRRAACRPGRTWC
jgi:excinuclease ABC subunit C